MISLALPISNYDKMTADESIMARQHGRTLNVVKLVQQSPLFWLQKVSPPRQEFGCARFDVMASHYRKKLMTNFGSGGPYDCVNI